METAGDAPVSRQRDVDVLGGDLPFTCRGTQRREAALDTLFDVVFDLVEVGTQHGPLAGWYVAQAANLFSQHAFAAQEAHPHLFHRRVFGRDLQRFQRVAVNLFEPRPHEDRIGEAEDWKV